MDLNAAAFAGVVVFAELSPALPHHPSPVLKWWLGAVGVTAVAAVFAVLVRTRVLGAWAHYAPLLLFFVAVQMLRAADGNGSAGFSPLLILPVVWYALYGTRASVFLTLAGVAAVQFGPLILVGGPEYPVTLWRGAVLWVVILALVGLAARRLVAALRDRTAALAASEARFRTAFDDAPVGVALVGASDAQLGVYLQVNRAMSALLGRSEDEIVGRSLLEFTHPDDRAMGEQHLLAPPEARLARTLEKRYLHSSGREVLASVTYSRIPIGPGGEPCFIVHVQDTTMRRDAERDLLTALEQQQQATARLRQLNQTRTALVSVVTKEIRGPIAGINDCAARLSTGSGKLSVQQRGLVREIETLADRLGGISADLLTVSQFEEDLADQAPALIDIEALVHGVIDSIRPIADGRELALQVEVSPSGAEVTVEADKVERVLTNLLDNAMKFTPTGGAIDTQVRVRGEAIEMEVSDTGTGIAKDEVDRIFDRNYRARAATEQGIPGSGLGLSIVKAIAEQHNGAVEVFSEPGAGSCFKVILPIGSPDAAGRGASSNGWSAR